MRFKGYKPLTEDEWHNLLWRMDSREVLKALCNAYINAYEPDKFKSEVERVLKKLMGSVNGRPPHELVERIRRNPTSE